VRLAPKRRKYDLLTPAKRSGVDLFETLKKNQQEQAQHSQHQSDTDPKSNPGVTAMQIDTQMKTTTKK